jgi:hypothetical protein
MLPTTTARVPEHTPDSYNEAIRRQTEENIAHCANAGREAIARRLAVLDQEWDIERALEANASSLALIGLGLGAFVDRRFFALPILVAGFLLQHALQGWCPPVPLLRRLGVRTAAEIEQERYALKALRGDFYDVHEATEGPRDGKVVIQALEAVRR